MREPVGYLWTEKANGEKSLRFDPPADLPYNREHWEWEPVYVGDTKLLGALKDAREAILDLLLPESMQRDGKRSALIHRIDMVIDKAEGRA